MTPSLPFPIQTIRSVFTGIHSSDSSAHRSWLLLSHNYLMPTFDIGGIASTISPACYVIPLPNSSNPAGKRSIPSERFPISNGAEVATRH